jgi:1-acyl-sn-glycerol-3-phosphate acyltransferase
MNWICRHLLRPVHWIHEFLVLYAGFALLIAGCLLWSLLALPLNLILRGRKAVWVGRRVACLGFRAYLFLLRASGGFHFDLTELDSLRNAGPLIIAPNHPGLLDALMIISRLPNIACVIKASLLDHILWGAGSRLAGYIRNDWFIGSINLAVAELHQGSQLLLFPEGTRTESPPQPNPFRGGLAFVACRAKIPVQTVFIEQDTNFLGKSWPQQKKLKLPMHFRVRLGRRFDPPQQAETFTQTLHAYFSEEMHSPGREHHHHH